MLKISLSLLGTTYYNYRFVIPNSDSNKTIPYSEQLQLIVYHIIGCILLYIILTILYKLLKWLFEVFFSKRLLPSVKKKYYDQFHKRALNYIFLGVSFENKFNLYLSQQLEDDVKEDYINNLDLAIGYFSQSVYFFDKVFSEIDEIIPQRIKKNGRKEKYNAAFLEYLGFPYVLISAASAYDSLERLENSIESMKQTLNKSTTSKSDYYTQAIDDLKDKQIVRLKDNYTRLLERTKSLNQKLIQINSLDLSV